MRLGGTRLPSPSTPLLATPARLPTQHAVPAGVSPTTLPRDIGQAHPPSRAHRHGYYALRERGRGPPARRWMTRLIARADNVADHPRERPHHTCPTRTPAAPHTVVSSDFSALYCRIIHLPSPLRQFLPHPDARACDELDRGLSVNEPSFNEGAHTCPCALSKYVSSGHGCCLTSAYTPCMCEGSRGHAVTVSVSQHHRLRPFRECWRRGCE